MSHEYDSAMTKAKLDSILDYDPETGEFTWVIGKQNVNIGQPAGTIATRVEGQKYIRIVIEKKPYLGQKLAYLTMMGGIPRSRIFFKDEDKTNLVWGNLYTKKGMFVDKGE